MTFDPSLRSKERSYYWLIILIRDSCPGIMTFDPSLRSKEWSYEQLIVLKIMLNKSALKSGVISN